MKRNRIFFVGFISAIFALSVLSSSTLLAEGVGDNASRLDSYNKLRKVIGTVESYYVDEIKINQIVDKAIEGLLQNLDAHSAFLSNKKADELKIQTDGEFGGLGITVGFRDGALTIIAPIEGTPADKAGLKSGDIILKIEEQSTLNMTIDEAVGLMRGKPKTTINITIVRKNEPKPIKFDIIRDIISVKSVYAKEIENSDILYLRVTSFDKNVVSRVKEEITKHSNKSGIVLDLRNNPGGLLDQAIGLSDLFIDEGLIVSQKGRIESENREFRATKSNTFTNIPLVVLVNEGSASASEIVSGALQDHKKAIVVGEKTFGKGSVQVILPLEGGEALRLTIARYYLPSGRTIQAVGVTPDLIVHKGKVPHIVDEFKIKESELKSHLEQELQKIDSGAQNSKVQKSEDDKKEDEVSLEDELNELNGLDGYENGSIITNENILDDIQLKSALDIIKAWKIIK